VSCHGWWPRALVLMWRAPQALRVGLSAGLGGAAGLGMGHILNALWSRPRPFVAESFAPLIGRPADPSFPSDHLIVLGAMTVAVWLATGSPGWTIAGLSAMVAVARAATGVHYVSDLVAGFCSEPRLATSSGGPWPGLRTAPALGRLPESARRAATVSLGRGEHAVGTVGPARHNPGADVSGIA
jgi:hypothetical protein